MPSPAIAEVPFSQAQVRSILNRVELLRRGQVAEPATRQTNVGLGDVVKTAAASRADLQFTDGSLIRLGEQATFRFMPQSRNLNLTTGTALLLIPEQQGKTTLETPVATLGIQGTAAVVRHIDDRDLTLVMALADAAAGPITITPHRGEQEVLLHAGQMALIQAGQVQIAEFDIAAFYDTSDLVQNLNLDRPPAPDSPPAPLNGVRQATTAALAAQAPFAQDSAVLDPAFISAGQDSASDSQLPPNNPIQEQSGNLDRYGDAPPGVVPMAPQQPPMTPEPPPSVTP